MSLNLFLPAHSPNTKLPVLFYLSGLTCTGDNCAEKGFLQPAAARAGIAIVYPDTSPRGASVAGEDDSWDFGTGAGFYVDATTPAFKTNYNMYSYITQELPGLLWPAFPQLDSSRVSVTGHSMGGHGALTLALRNPGMFRSVSAFAPIANPCECAWGKKAFSGYLGDDAAAWKKYDATELLRESKNAEFKALVDVGTGDGFYKEGQLRPEVLEAAGKDVGADVQVRYQKVGVDSPGLWARADGHRITITAITSSRRSPRTTSTTTQSSCASRVALELEVSVEDSDRTLLLRTYNVPMEP